jgi:hypothetical protein
LKKTTDALKKFTYFGRVSKYLKQKKEHFIIQKNFNKIRDQFIFLNSDKIK